MKAPGDETFVALPNFPPEGRSIVDTPLPPASKSTIDWPEWLAAATNPVSDGASVCQLPRPLPSERP